MEARLSIFMSRVVVLARPLARVDRGQGRRAGAGRTAGSRNEGRKRVLPAHDSGPRVLAPVGAAEARTGGAGARWAARLSVASGGSASCPFGEGRARAAERTNLRFKLVTPSWAGDAAVAGLFLAAPRSVPPRPRPPPQPVLSKTRPPPISPASGLCPSPLSSVHHSFPPVLSPTPPPTPPPPITLALRPSRLRLDMPIPPSNDPDLPSPHLPTHPSHFDPDSASPPFQLNTSSPQPKKKHVCSTCSRAFTTSGHLARHTRIHTGERNHKCPFPGCETRCSRQDNLQQQSVFVFQLSPSSAPPPIIARLFPRTRGPCVASTRPPHGQPVLLPVPRPSQLSSRSGPFSC